jgi:hypothetical protein
MRFRVLKPFSVGKPLARGDEVELDPNRRTQELVLARFLLPIDPVVEVQTKSPSNAGTDISVARQSKRKVEQ